MNGIIQTLLLAAAPISELRGAIPVAIGIYGMTWWQALIIAVIGNMIPVFFILWFLDPVSKWLRKNFRIFDKFFTWLFDYTRKRHAKKMEVYKELALIILVAIPLPLTGAWTGSLVAFLFGIPYKKALPLIFLGVLIAGVIVTLVSVGALNIGIFVK
jgi:uncharacterized membrane protein